MATTRQVTCKRLSCGNRYTHPHIYNVRAAELQSAGSVIERVGCPLIHLQAWKFWPGHRAQRQETKEVKTEATFVGEAPGCHSPCTWRLAAGDGQIHFSWMAALCSHPWALSLPATTCNSWKQAPGDPGCSANSPPKPKETVGETGFLAPLRSALLGKRGWT